MIYNRARLLQLDPSGNSPHWPTPKLAEKSNFRKTGIAPHRAEIGAAAVPVTRPAPAATTGKFAEVVRETLVTKTSTGPATCRAHKLYNADDRE